MRGLLKAMLVVTLAIPSALVQAAGGPYEYFYGFGFGEASSATGFWSAHGSANAVGEVSLDAHVSDSVPSVNRDTEAGAAAGIGSNFNGGPPSFKLAPGTYLASVTIAEITADASALGPGYAAGQLGLSLTCNSCQVIEGTPIQPVVNTIPVLAPNHVANGTATHTMKFNLTSPDAVIVEATFDVHAYTGPFPIQQAVGFGEATIQMSARVTDVSLTLQS